MSTFPWAVEKCGKLDIVLTEDVWDEPEHILIHLIRGRHVPEISKVISERKKAVCAVKRFGEILSLPLVEYVHNTPPEDHELYIDQCIDLIARLFPHDGVDLLHPLEYFDKYDKIWWLIVKEKISHERIVSALDQLVREDMFHRGRHYSYTEKTCRFSDRKSMTCENFQTHVAMAIPDSIRATIDPCMLAEEEKTPVTRSE